MNAMVQVSTWRCRECGVSNPLHSRTCSQCPTQRPMISTDVRSVLETGMLAQVLNPGAQVVNNNIYNFASSDGDVSVLTHNGDQRPGTDEHVEATPQISPLRRAFYACLYVSGIIGALTFGMVFATFCIVVVLAVAKLH